MINIIIKNRSRTVFVEPNVQIHLLMFPSIQPGLKAFVIKIIYFPELFGKKTTKQTTKQQQNTHKPTNKQTIPKIKQTKSKKHHHVFSQVINSCHSIQQQDLALDQLIPSYDTLNTKL